MHPEDAGPRIEARDLDDPVARALERLVAADIGERYGGGEGEPPIDASPFRPPGGVFLVAWIGDEPVGCAGLRPLDAVRGELKRMYVVPAARGRGVAVALLRAIEDEARARAHRELWLETGTAQPEAMQLYEREGYRAVPPYGQYKEYPASRCYARTLTG